MKSFNIVSLANAISKSNKPKITYTKPSRGEKLFEELVTENEAVRTVSLKSYFVVVPEINEDTPILYKKINQKYKDLPKIDEPLKSNKKLLTLNEIKVLLKKSKLL